MKNQLISTSNFAKAVRSTVFLIKNIWKEHTTLLVHSPRQIEKTEKVLEIAAEVVTPDRPAVYVNTEDSLDAHLDKLTAIEGLSILTPAYESAEGTTDYADLVISAIEEVIEETDIRTFFIDSVTRIAALSFGRNASPAYIMKRLVALQLRTGCSFLIISHDSTKSTDRALRNLAASDFSDFPTHSDQPVGMLPEASALPQIVGSQPVATDPSSPSDMSDPSPISEKPSPKPLSRRERRLLRRQNKKIPQNFPKNFGGLKNCRTFATLSARTGA